MGKYIVVIYLTLLIRDNLARQKYDDLIKQNADFLSREAVGSNNGKRDYIAPQPENTGGKNNYNSQFPPLGERATTPKVSTTANSHLNTPTPGRRDFVNPNYPPFKPGSANPQTTKNSKNPGKQDQFPPLGGQATTPKLQHHSNNQGKQDQFPPLNGNGFTTKSPITSPKRDYTNPNFPPLKPVQHPRDPQAQTGKVKDLINYFGGTTAPTQKTPSYSSILGKPSFSTTVTGHNKPSTTAASPTANIRPGSPVRTTPTVLPSSIVNNNKKNSNTNSFTDAELQALSEELLRKDTNNAAKFLTTNYQEKTSSTSKEDKAPQKLFTVGADVWNIPTIQKFVPLLDNYERDTLVNEYVTPQERNEENAFMDAIMSTSVIRHLMNSLKEKGLVTPDPKQQRDFLKQLWFSLYSRGKGKISSSGFEHIFVSELKNGEVSGLHNWIYFAKEEAVNRVNYLGYLKYAELNDKGAVLKLHFNQQGIDKPVNTMFLGTSPELEMAIYTLCFVTRADSDCNLKLANKDVNIVTHTFRYRSKNLIGSAYPQI